MIRKIILISVFASFLFNCEKELQNADSIVQKSILVSGAEMLQNSKIAFEFRDKQYSATRHNGQFALSRLIIKTSDSIFDVLDNNGFNRYINGERIKLADSTALKYSASVNSVHYFSVLPYGLDSKAVNKSFLGTTKIKGMEYYKIKITFNEDGGGEDFEDVFIYWIHTKTFKADYLAYSYSENHGVGLRFREAYNERFIEGIRFVDYNNYKPKADDAVLEHLDSKFENNELELLSKIELENVLVLL
ncbi:DUF6503 family protein [Algibacter sp. 2305UL17-15]|uniref:DUF6503 family protein n=1 Tax=Algibacter sp. 2305UL17-15 TaxID=3231268 RepID=UPI0034597806